jgi:Icc-related predicted phosphoesterase
MLDKEDVATAKEIAKVLRESKVDELVVAGNLITVLLAEREQQRTWVGLTDDERLGIRSRVQEYTPIDSVKYGEAIQYATEQALMEKNA